ncbi:MAG: IPT/TIG domain-containing protein [Elusimicrobiota bacterium]
MKLRYKYLLSAAMLAAILLMIIEFAWTEAPRGGEFHAVPLLVSLLPDAISAGSPGFALTLSGANFTKDSAVRWDGEERPTVFVDEDTLRARIPANDVASPGSRDVTVVARENSAASNVLVFHVMPPGEGR